MPPDPENGRVFANWGNIATLEGKASQAIPYPSPERLASLLSDAAVRQLLPELIGPSDVNEKDLLDRTLLQGKFRSVTKLLKAFLLKAAPSMVGFGLALAFAAAFASRFGGRLSPMRIG